MWKNTFLKTAASKQRVLQFGEVQEFDKKKTNLINQEKVLKKLQSDIKDNMASIESMFRSENKLLQNLRGLNMMDSELTQLLDCWLKNSSEQEKIHHEYIIALSTVLGDSAKKLQNTFNSFHAGLKKWDNSIQQCLKDGDKLNKLQEKDKTTQIIAKLEQQEKLAAASRSDFDTLHECVINDMDRLVASSCDYLHPAIEAFISIQIDYNKKLQMLYSKLCSQINADAFGGSDKVYTEQMHQRLQAIKSLSIVAE